MNGKGLGSRLIIAIFIVMICLPKLWWILLGDLVDRSDHENRSLAARPQFTFGGRRTFPAEYEAYFNDAIPFRNNLITINSAIDYFIFNRSSNEKVVLGTDDQLFYANTDDGDPIGHYQGTNLFSEERLQAIAQNCMDIRSFLDGQGKEFVVFIAPNKERIYSGDMPERYGDPSDVYKALQVVEYLRANTDIRVVYPYEELMRARSILPEDIWYRTDTHWNAIGGYIGAKALLSELGIDMPDITDDEISIIEGEETAGDLAEMLNLADLLKSADHEYEVSGYDDHDVESIKWDFYDAIIYHAEGADPRKIYVYRDSFASQMARYIGSQFQDSYLRHKDTYSYDDLVQQDPDIFVYETVERFIDGLEDFSIR